MKLITLSLVAPALSATTVLAQTTQFYGPNGQYQGSATRFGNTTTFYGPAGQYQGSANTFGQYDDLLRFKRPVSRQQQ
jgi:hypothetical protein